MGIHTADRTKNHNLYSSVMILSQFSKCILVGVGLLIASLELVSLDGQKELCADTRRSLCVLGRGGQSSKGMNRHSVATTSSPGN